jgi:hypothetical protein
MTLHVTWIEFKLNWNQRDWISTQLNSIQFFCHLVTICKEVYVNPTCLQKLNRTCTMSRLSKSISSPSMGVLEKFPYEYLTCSWIWQDFWKQSPKQKSHVWSLFLFNALEIQSSFLCNSCIENKIFVFYNLDFQVQQNANLRGITGLFNLLVSEFRWRLETESTKKLVEKTLGVASPMLQLA